MLKQVLESVSEMLRDGLAHVHDEHTINAEGKAYITCAKVLLDKTVSGMGGETKLESVNKKPITVFKEEEKFIIDVELGILKSIKYESGKELEVDRMVEINGMAYEYVEAKGKPFQEGRVL